KELSMWLAGMRRNWRMVSGSRPRVVLSAAGLLVNRAGHAIHEFDVGNDGVGHVSSLPRRGRRHMSPFSAPGPPAVPTAARAFFVALPLYQPRGRFKTFVRPGG